MVAVSMVWLLGHNYATPIIELYCGVGTIGFIQHLNFYGHAPHLLKVTILTSDVYQQRPSSGPVRVKTSDWRLNKS